MAVCIRYLLFKNRTSNIYNIFKIQDDLDLKIACQSQPVRIRELMETVSCEK